MASHARGGGTGARVHTCACATCIERGWCAGEVSRSSRTAVPLSCATSIEERPCGPVWGGVVCMTSHVRGGETRARVHTCACAACLGRVVRDDIGDDDGDSDEDGIRMAKYGTGEYSCANNKTEE